MIHFPDYRKETDKLNDVDKAFINGYRKAIEGVQTKVYKPTGSI